MNETIATIIQWHEKTFPDATLDGQKTKFAEELGEYKESADLEELADMFIVACGIARFNSIVALEYFAVVFKALLDWELVGVHGLLMTIIDDKMKKNRVRTWKKTGGGTYHHTKEGNDEKS